MASLNRREQTKLNYMQNGGNMKKAMIDAGYSETYADKNAQYLWGIIGKEIQAQQNEIKTEQIKSVQQIQERWSAWMDSEELSYNERIKCSELLAKSQGGFIENVNVRGNINNPLAGLSTDELKKLVIDD